MSCTMIPGSYMMKKLQVNVGTGILFLWKYVLLYEFRFLHSPKLDYEFVFLYWQLLLIAIAIYYGKKSSIVIPTWFLRYIVISSNYEVHFHFFSVRFGRRNSPRSLYVQNHLAGRFIENNFSS